MEYRPAKRAEREQTAREWLIYYNVQVMVRFLRYILCLIPDTDVVSVAP